MHNFYKTEKCPVCGGKMLFFKEHIRWYYCIGCRRAGPVLKNARAADKLQRRWNLFRAYRRVFEESIVDVTLLNNAGLSSSSRDPIRILTKDKLYGYADEFGDFQKKFNCRKQQTLTEKFRVSSYIKKKPALILPLEDAPGMVRGYTAVMQNCKFSKKDGQTRDDLHTYIQVSDKDEIHYFDDIIDDFEEICRTLMFDRDSTIAVKPCKYHKINSKQMRPVSVNF